MCDSTIHAVGNSRSGARIHVRRTIHSSLFVISLYRLCIIKAKGGKYEAKLQVRVAFDNIDEYIWDMLRYKDKKFDYYFNGEVVDGTKDECEMNVAKASLYLIGKNPISIKQGDEFVDPGFNAYDETGKDVSRDVVVTGNVDTSKVGTYEIVYTLTIDGIITERKRTVVRIRKKR